MDAINFNDHQFKEFLEQINESKSLRTLKFSRIPLDTDFKLGLMNSFLAGNKKLIRVELSQNMLNSLEILSQIFINKCLKEISLTQQSYFKTSLMSPNVPTGGGSLENQHQFPWSEPAEKTESQDDENKYLSFEKLENRTLEKLTLGLGLMCTIKPLV